MCVAGAANPTERELIEALRLAQASYQHVHFKLRAAHVLPDSGSEHLLPEHMA